MSNLANGKNDKIFIVDDDSSINEILMDMLTSENYNVQTFTKGKDAISKAKEYKPDLILLDYFLAGEDTSQVVHGLRNILGDDLPVILMSASIQAKEMQKKLSANEFVAKPFHRKTLLDVINRNIK